MVSRSHVALLCGGAVLVALVGGAIFMLRPNVFRPAWAEENYPGYQALTAAYRELGYRIRTAEAESPLEITNVASLALRLSNSFPDSVVSTDGTNPFSTLLPQQNVYQTASSWRTGASNTPLVWTTILLRQPTVIYLTVDGRVDWKPKPAFREQLQNEIRNGNLYVADPNNR